MNKVNYPSINGLRAIGVILAILSHLDIKYSIFKNISENVFVELFTNFLHDGNLGVNIFFVVSGFLISSILLQEEKINGKVSIQNFYIRRTLRIFPAYYFLLFVYFVLQAYNLVNISYDSWLTALTYTKYFNWVNDLITSHLWSLSVEEHFYLFFPLLFIGGDRFRKRSLLLLFLVVPLFRVSYHYTKISWLNDLTLFTRIDAISIGCICAFYKNEILTILNKNWTKWFYASILGLIALRFTNLLAYKVDLEILFVPFGVTAGTFANVFIAIIIMYSVFGPKKTLHAFLNLKFISFIGLISYSLYLWQQIFIFGNLGWIRNAPLNLLFIFIMALFSYYVIEKPFLKLKSKFENK